MTSKGVGEIKNATSSEVREEFADTLNRVAYTDEAVLIERHGRPIAALVSYRAFKLFQDLMDRLEDRLDSEALEASSDDALLDFDVVVKEANRGDGGALLDRDAASSRKRSKKRRG